MEYSGKNPILPRIVVLSGIALSVVALFLPVLDETTLSQFIAYQNPAAMAWFAFLAPEAFAAFLALLPRSAFITGALSAITVVTTVISGVCFLTILDHPISVGSMPVGVIVHYLSLMLIISGSIVMF